MPTADDVVWVPCEKKHLQALQSFICTSPAKEIYEKVRGPHHPLHWELDVQSGLRALRFPRPKGEGLILGFLGDELVAASNFGTDLDGTQFVIRGVAVSQEHKGQRIGTALLAVTLNELRANKELLQLHAAVFTRIHPKNTASRRLFEAAGFDCLGDIDGHGLEYWIHDLEPTT